MCLGGPKIPPIKANPVAPVAQNPAAEAARTQEQASLRAAGGLASTQTTSGLSGTGAGAKKLSGGM